jgi:hypothetical protein
MMLAYQQNPMMMQGMGGMGGMGGGMYWWNFTLFISIIIQNHLH